MNIRPCHRTGANRGLPPLVAPDHLKGRMSRHTDRAILAERREWAAARGEEGHSSGDVARALETTQPTAHRVMTAGGWKTWTYAKCRGPNENP